MKGNEITIERKVFDWDYACVMVMMGGFAGAGVFVLAMLAELTGTFVLPFAIASMTGYLFILYLTRQANMTDDPWHTIKREKVMVVGCEKRR